MLCNANASPTAASTPDGGGLHSHAGSLHIQLVLTLAASAPHTDPPGWPRREAWYAPSRPATGWYGWMGVPPVHRRRSSWGSTRTRLGLCGSATYERSYATSETNKKTPQRRVCASVHLPSPQLTPWHRAPATQLHVPIESPFATITSRLTTPAFAHLPDSSGMQLEERATCVSDARASAPAPQLFPPTEAHTRQSGGSKRTMRTRTTMRLTTLP
jgi:hypothetical protein